MVYDKLCVGSAYTWCKLNKHGANVAVRLGILFFHENYFGTFWLHLYALDRICWHMFEIDSKWRFPVMSSHSIKLAVVYWDNSWEWIENVCHQMIFFFSCHCIPPFTYSMHATVYFFAVYFLDLKWLILSLDEKRKEFANRTNIHLSVKLLFYYCFTRCQFICSVLKSKQYQINMWNCVRKNI